MISHISLRDEIIFRSLHPIGNIESFALLKLKFRLEQDRFFID